MLLVDGDFHPMDWSEGGSRGQSTSEVAEGWQVRVLPDLTTAVAARRPEPSPPSGDGNDRRYSIVPRRALSGGAAPQGLTCRPAVRAGMRHAQQRENGRARRGSWTRDPRAEPLWEAAGCLNCLIHRHLVLANIS